MVFDGGLPPRPAATTTTKATTGAFLAAFDHAREAVHEEGEDAMDQAERATVGA